MRLSPVLVAVFTASATFGLSNSANGQTAYSESESSLSSQEAFEPINPSLNQSETHAKPSLDVNQSIPSTPINSFEGIVLNKTKSPYPDLAFSLGQSIGNQVSYAWVNTSYSQNLPEFNPSQPLINSALDSSLNPTESEVLPENYISLNKGKNTEDLEKLAQVSTEVSSEISNTEANDFSNSAIILNKAETAKVGNFSFPVLTEDVIALNSNLPESDLFQPSLNKDSEKIAQFPTPVPEKIAIAEINNFSNLGIILNKAETAKVGNFSFPVLTEEAIALNSNLPESDLFQPSLHKDSEKIAQFPTPVPEKIAIAEINNFSNLGIILNKAETAKVGNFSFPVLTEEAIALNSNLPESDLFQPSLNKDSEKIAQFPTPVPEKIAIAEINNFSNLGIILNKAETAKVGNFSFPVLTEDAIILNSNLPESDLFQPSLHKDSEKIAQFPTPIPEKIAIAEINNFSNLGIILNKAETAKVGNFSFPVLTEDVIALNSNLPESDLFQPSLNKDSEKIAQFPTPVPEKIAIAEINNFSNLGIILNKAETAKVGNFSFPVLTEDAIILNSNLPESDLFQPSLHKDSEKIAQFPTPIPEKIAIAEINNFSNLGIILNKAETEKVGNFSFPVLTEEAIALNSNLPESDLFQPSLHKDSEKIAQFPTPVPEKIAIAEINNFSNLGIILNKAETAKVGNFSFPVLTEDAIALNSNLPESDLFQPSLNKNLEKISQFSPIIPLTIAQATPETLPPNSEVPIQPETPATIPLPSTPAPSETEVLVGEITVTGTQDQGLIEKVYSVISTQPGRTTTRTQLQRDINSIFATGLFRNVKAVPEDTPLGVRVTFEVEENPIFKEVVIQGNTVLPQEIINESFGEQLNKTINLNQIEAGIKKVNQWYQDNGYVLAQVVAAPEVTKEGVVNLEVAEGVIENIGVRFLNSDGEATDEEGKPISGRTRDFIITREIQLKPGDVFNQKTAQQDLARVFGLGIFEDVRLELEPGKDNPREAVVVVNVIEKTTGSLAFGGGVSSAARLFGTLSYQEVNLGGNNQRLGAELEAGNRVFQMDLNFTDPWIAGDPYRTSYSVNAFRRRTISVVFENGPKEVYLANGDRPRVVRTGGGISFTRPYADNVFSDPNWVASVGFQYQRVEITDSDGNINRTDEFGNQLSYSGSGKDDLFTVQFGFLRDRRNNKQQPTSGYLVRFGSEQSIPVGSGSILMNRLRAAYTFYVPVKFLSGLIPEGDQSFAFNFQGGTVIGNLPPYEAFPLGGTTSVRGWEEGAIASTRSFIQASIEYRFPLFSKFLGGALFVDAATDLGSQGTVPGSPGGVRDKPGSGFGYGVGVRLQTPLGPVRIDYGINNNGDGRIHFGLGERF